MRSGTVELVDSGGAVHITGTTRDDGSFTLSTSEAFGSMTVAVRISTQSAYGVVFQPNGSYWTAYSALQTVTSGSTWSGVAIVLDRDTETNRGFAILDELRTLGAYYQGIRDAGWPVARLGVSYPSGEPSSFADRATNLIYISGGETLCDYPDGHTDWCPEDAYDWDVVAHESGHVVAYQGGFDASAGLVFADVVGYYVFSPQASTASTYVPLTPTRILGPADITTAGDSIPVAPLGKGGIPTTGVSAVVAHVIVRSGTSGNATVYPDGVTKPGTWDASFGTDYYYANLVPAKLGSNGQFRISTSVAARVYVDVVGYFRTPAGTAGESTPVGLRPWRIVDPVSVPAGATYTLSPLGTQSPDGTRNIPSTGVAAVAFTLTACASAIGAISVYPAGVTDPGTGNLYYHPSYNGYPTCWSLLQSAKLGSNGQIVLHNRGNVPVSISVDVDGYYRT